MRASVCAALVFVIALGCSGTTGGVSDGREPITVRDSAGIRIVEIEGAVLDSLPVYRIADSPVAAIGELDGEDPYLFTSIGQVRVMPDGGTAILDRGTSEIRIFDREGRWVRTLGGVGEGPGEFSQAVMGSTIMFAALEVGGIVTYDRGPDRVTVFGDTGDVVEAWLRDMSVCQYEQSSGGRTRFCSVFGLFSDGSLALSREADVDADAFPDGHVIDDLRRHFYREERGHVTDIASVPLPAERVYTITRSNGATRNIASPPIHTGVPTVSVGAESFAVLFTDRYEIRVYGTDGVLQRMIRVRMNPIPITGEQKARVLENVAPGREVLGVGDVRPMAGGLITGEGGELWVRDWSNDEVIGEDVPQVYTVFGNDGIPHARVFRPSGDVFRGQQVSFLQPAPPGIERFRVVTVDSLGVNRVLVFTTEPADTSGSRE